MPRLVFLHGFTQTHHHWHAAAHLLAGRVDPGSTLAFVDLPGHGLASHDPDGDIDAVGPRLVAVAGPGTYIGYSMGGRIALATAATGAPAVERLVLIGATPGIEDDDERAARARLDDERARRVERVGVDTFVEEWLAMPMFAGLPPDRDGVEHRRRNTSAGLAHSLRAYGTGAQRPLWDRLAAIRIPVLVLAGERDGKFADVGARMAAALPHGAFDTVPGAGHAAHTEQPAATVALIARWLNAPPTGARQAGGSADGQADREQQPVDELGAAGLAEDGNEIRTGRTVEHPPDGLPGGAETGERDQ